MKDLVIFGTGDVAQIARYYFDIDSDYKPVAFTVNEAYIEEAEFDGLPVVAFENITELYPPDKYDLFIALSYSGLNKIREEKFNEAAKLGYHTPSYISSKCTYLSQFEPGKNCFIFEDNTVQPFVKIEDNVTLWSGNHIGHHSTIHSHNFVSSHVVISGHCEINSYCFLGVNSTVGHQVTIAEGTLLGAGTVISKDTEQYGLYVPARSVKLDKKSSEIKL